MAFEPAEMVQFDDVVAIADTPAAVLCVIEDDKVWIPRSQIAKGSEVQNNEDEGSLLITKWIAKKKGLL